MTDPDPATQHRQEVLNDLLAVGMRFIQRADVRAEAEPETMPEMAAVYERVSRAVCRTVALQHRLDRAPKRTEQRVLARRQVIRAVEDAIDHRAATPTQAERLGAEFRERLDSPELEHEIADRPVGDVIADICHDLGLGTVQGLYFHKRRTPTDVAELCATAARPPHPGTPADFPLNQPERFFRTVPSPNGDEPH
jgi:hypothetical protein